MSRPTAARNADRAAEDLIPGGKRRWIAWRIHAVRVGERTVASVNGCREMLNVRGQIALKVVSDDGGEAIVRAQPRR